MYQSINNNSNQLKIGSKTSNTLATVPDTRATNINTDRNLDRNADSKNRNSTKSYQEFEPLSPVIGN